ncbi:Uma2 family endonuclease [Oscillatoria amoena NRMC-F 0135]|nr:Uma2 family endonuclease [Oscillatoria amoena NRMC-F 0135]
MLSDLDLSNRILKGPYIEQMTDEEFFRFCQDNRDFKFERTPQGQIIFMSPTCFLTGDRNSEIITQLRNWNKKNKGGHTVDSDTGFYLPNGAMRNPDAAWISYERLNKLPKEELERFPHVCPDFIVELKSKSDRLQDLKTKMNEWIDNGCRLGWLIDADEEIVYIYAPGQPENVHRGFDTPLSGEPVLHNFQLILSELRV